MAANTSSITQFLPEDLAAFVREHPDLRVQLIEQTSADILDAVRSGETELGVYLGFTDAPGVQPVLYGRDTLVIAAPSDHRIADFEKVIFADVLSEDFVALQQGSSIQHHLERQAYELNSQIRTRVEAMSFDSVRRMVQARLGIAILPLGAVELYLEGTEFVMIPIEEDWARRELHIAMRDRDSITVQSRAVEVSGAKR